jgi:anti-anti-sigma factor
MSPALRLDDRLHVDHRVEGTAVVVRAVGEVDMFTAPVLAKQLTRAAEVVTPPAPLVADFRELRFFGSSGISALLVAYQQCQRQSVPLRVVAGPAVTRRLGMVGVLDVLMICPTLTDALRSTAETV